MAQFPVSGPDQAGDGLRRLADLRGRHLAALGGSLGYAVPQMVFHQAQRHRLQRPGHRRHLGQDVDAVLVFLDHPLQPAHLALDPAQPGEVSLLVRGVSVHIAPLATAPGALPYPGTVSTVVAHVPARSRRANAAASATAAAIPMATRMAALSHRTPAAGARATWCKMEVSSSQRLTPRLAPMISTRNDQATTAYAAVTARRGARPWTNVPMPSTNTPAGMTFTPAASRVAKLRPAPVAAAPIQVNRPAVRPAPVSSVTDTASRPASQGSRATGRASRRLPRPRRASAGPRRTGSRTRFRCLSRSVPGSARRRPGRRASSGRCAGPGGRPGRA